MTKAHVFIKGNVLSVEERLFGCFPSCTKGCPGMVIKCMFLGLARSY